MSAPLPNDTDARLLNAVNPKCPHCGGSVLRERLAGTSRLDRFRVGCMYCDYTRIVERVTEPTKPNPRRSLPDASQDPAPEVQESSRPDAPSPSPSPIASDTVDAAADATPAMLTVIPVDLEPPPCGRHCCIIGRYWTVTDTAGRVMLQIDLDDVTAMLGSFQR